MMWASASWTTRPVELYGIASVFLCRAVDVDRGHALARSHHDQVALVVPVVALAMDRTLRHMEEVARFGVDDLTALYSRLHPKSAVSDVDRRLVLAVVMPARAHPGLGADEARPEALDLDRSLTGHAGRGIGFDAFFGGDQPNGFRLAHVRGVFRETAPMSTVDGTDLTQLTATELLDLYRERATSPVEATQAVLDRIDALNPTLNAFCLVDADSALASAAGERGALAAG